MAKKRNNRSGAQRPSGGGSSVGTRSTTSTATRPAAKWSPPNGTNGANGGASSSSAKGGNLESASQRDRILAARQRNAATRAAADRRRSLEGGWLRRQWPMVAAVVTVLLIIAVFFAIARNASSGSASIGNPAPDSVLSKVTGVSQSTYEKVGKGSIANPFQKAQGNPPLNKASDGKPILLYVGAEYCPFCAAERWSMAVALSRFGTFSNLTLMQSSSTDSYANTSTFSFHGASYTSQYLVFQSVETETRTGGALEKMTAEQQAIFSKYDAPPYIDSQYAGSIPFLSVGNQYIEISAGFIPDQMQGLTWQEIADKLNDPNSSISQSVVANANYITAALCQVTDNKPANVCTAAPIPQIISDMKAGK